MSSIDLFLDKKKPVKAANAKWGWGYLLSCSDIAG